MTQKCFFQPTHTFVTLFSYTDPQLTGYQAKTQTIHVLDKQKQIYSYFEDYDGCMYSVTLPKIKRKQPQTVREKTSCVYELYALRIRLQLF